MPEVREKGTPGERGRLSSATLPLWCPKVPEGREVLPLLYPHGLSTRNFVPAPERSAAPPPDRRRPPSTG
ncbi:hypothetical protein [Actinacidiphila glaucinigra]|uniref:hypothetical protein n=1 Tax=Actinacidiphila glaucinigra TaxID=235986 RepID=UPI0036EE8FA3